MRQETDRLIIRAFARDDFTDYFAYITEPELMRMLGLNGVTDEASARETFDWLMKNRTFLALEKKETGRVIGHICIHPPYAPVAGDPALAGKTGCSLSFAIARGERRKGYMEEALRAVIAELFSVSGTDYIDCEYTDSNAASHALQEKLGFAYWGREALDDTTLIINLLKKERAAMPLRPHHGMCFPFYEGKGYSADFTDHMGRVIRALSERPETPVRLTYSADAVCAHCPNNLGGICKSADKVMRYDAAVLDACAFSDGDALPYADFAAKVKERILDAGLRQSICGDCEWDAICSKHRREPRSGDPAVRSDPCVSKNSQSIQGAKMKEELYLSLNDNEWPDEGTDHDRQIVRAIVTDGAGGFVFMRLNRDDDFGKATLIETSGGGVEPGEDLIAAIKRELMEELGAKVDVLTKIGVISDYYHLIHRHNINHYYLCRVRSFGQTHMTDDEINRFHLSRLTLTYAEALAEYERCACSKLGRLIYNREVPILKRAQELLTEYTA